MRERDIEQYWIRRVREAGGLTRKFTSPGRRAVPDQICAFPGNVVALVELKAPGEKARPDQVREHNRWKALGVQVYVISEKEHVDVVIDWLKCQGEKP